MEELSKGSGSVYGTGDLIGKIQRDNEGKTIKKTSESDKSKKDEDVNE
ncbi:hypothetical protein [Bacillus subtilis]|nr:hypothetical protein [Bacillus subtilis]GLI90571.1 hypothetical protein ANABIO4_39230 [Bacillus subtilis]